MKKKNIAHIGTCSAILALLFGAGALSLHTNAALRGDINEDGKINANDYIALRRALLAGESLSSKTADVNDDGDSKPSLQSLLIYFIASLYSS